MRQILSRSLVTVAAAGSILAAAGGYASADTGAEGAATGSPGVLSGNNVQAPVDVPVNACGNTVNAVGVGNAAFGNQCANESHSVHADSGDGARADAYGVDEGSRSVATGSPGVLSGNSVTIPVHAPVNACGNTVDAVGLLNPAMGNSCVNGQQASSVATPPPGTPDTPPSPPRVNTPPATPDLPPAQPGRTHRTPVPVGHPQPGLADTGMSAGQLGAAGGTSAALLVGGAMLYRRGMRRPAYAGRRH
ncbi:Small secreted domain [Streptomyces sp. DvalAA-14]|uniref:chaplin n=1 Tax=unclassified Streptomyces TaxID=2593676 RepID=UPI00081B7ECE|nr:MULTISPECIES: chaplin [unclassified Streptomyces]MYS21384.1 DUF320 domain-containing protein [Streptomyces sp. SID4948]SCD91223.1 Small secreted domain [Streptomyces sp. DvalAA-14]